MASKPRALSEDRIPVRFFIEGATIPYDSSVALQTEAGATIELYMPPPLDLGPLMQTIEAELRDLHVNPVDAAASMDLFAENLVQAGLARYLAQRMRRVG
jgi:hypothetical protein